MIAPPVVTLAIGAEQGRGQPQAGGGRVGRVADLGGEALAERAQAAAAGPADLRGTIGVCDEVDVVVADVVDEEVKHGPCAGPQYA